MTRTHVGLFLLTLASLALEVTLVRILSVVAWYHLAYFAIATAMLGGTAGAVTVYLRRDWTDVNRVAAYASAAFALVLLPSLSVLMVTPIAFELNALNFAGLIAATLACVAPFYAVGVAVTVALTRSTRPIGGLYAADLLGASVGVLAALAGLTFLDAPSVVLACTAGGAAAALAFSGGTSRVYGVAFVGACVLVVVHASGPSRIAPVVVKGEIVNPQGYESTHWNAFSRVAVYEGAELPPQYWGASPLAPQTPIRQHVLDIDGEALTTVRRLRDADSLRFDVTNAAYAIRPDGSAAVIGLGGGRDVQAAILAGHARVVGIDVNPVFVELLEGRFREFVGVADAPGVELVADEARSWLSRTDERFDVVQMALVDTWAATGAGAFSLTENTLYTVEAWGMFLKRLTTDGVLTVSRWHNAGNVGEAGRVVSLAVAALLDAGVENPRAHIVMLSSGGVATLIVGREPLGADDVTLLEAEALLRAFRVEITPTRTSPTPILAAIVSSRTTAQLDAAVSGFPLDFSPPTDESPYFFNVLRLSRLDALAQFAGRGVVEGNLRATGTLLATLGTLALGVALTVVAPLMRGGRGGRVRPAFALYFALIGAGFMFVEIGMLQRLTVLLTHPVYALGVILFTIILSAGVGSLLSDGLTRFWALPLAMVTAVGVWGASLATEYAAMTLMTAGMPLRVLAAVALIAPLGVLLGVFFPLGMRYARALQDEGVAWYWALNGIAGVLCAALAVFVAVYAGIEWNFTIAALCYAALGGVVIHIRRQTA